MKKVILIAGMFVFTSALLTSCGGSMESDVQKMADLGCKTQELYKKAMSGDESVKAEMEKLNKEFEDFAAKMEKKYTNKEDQDKIGQLVMEKMGNCK